MSGQKIEWKRIAGSFAVMAGCAFLLFVLAALLNFLASAVGLSTPERLTAIITSLSSSGTLQAIMAIWLLTAALAIVAPGLWRVLSIATALLFDIGYGVLGALTGFGLAIGIFGSNWYVLMWAAIYSAVVAAGYFAVKRWLVGDVQAMGQARWIVAAVLAIAAPVLLLWL
jgi:hypothetical protein